MQLTIMPLFMSLSVSLSNYPNTRGSSSNPFESLFNKQDSFLLSLVIAAAEVDG